MNTTTGTVTFYICPQDGGFWSPAGPNLMNYAPADRVNGGPRTCPNCAGAQARYDDERYDHRRDES